MYQLHIGVILNDKYWSMHSVQNMENFETSDIILAYFGNLNFKDTVKHKITSETIDLPLHLLACMELPFLTSRTRVPKKKAIEQHASSDGSSDKGQQQDPDPEHNSAQEDNVCDNDQDGNEAGYASSGNICADHDDSATEAYCSDDVDIAGAQTDASAQPFDASDASKNSDLSVSRDEPDLTSNIDVDKPNASPCDASKNSDLSVSREEPNLTSNLDVDKLGAPPCDASKNSDLSVSREEPDLMSNIDVDEPNAPPCDASKNRDLSVSREEPNLTSNLDVDKPGAPPCDASDDSENIDLSDSISDSDEHQGHTEPDAKLLKFGMKKYQPYVLLQRARLNNQSTPKL